MSVIATICARGGSQGLPGKNIKKLCGKPLINYTIEQALACPEIDFVYISTDDQKIADVAKQAGAIVPFIRPKSLATNSAAKLPVIKHLIEWIEESGIEVDVIVDLDPTSPLRDVNDISRSIEKLDMAESVITGYQSDKNPYFNMVEYTNESKPFVEISKRSLTDIIRRQEASMVYSMNASVYVWKRKSFSESLWSGKVALYEMPRERSIDIDSPIDFKLVELLMSEKIKNG